VNQWNEQLLEGIIELFTRGKKSQAKDEGMTKDAGDSARTASQDPEGNVRHHMELE